MEDRYVCRIPTAEEMGRRWDDEIARHTEKQNWIVWKAGAFAAAREGRSIPYYGFLDGVIICEATAVPRPGIRQDGAGPEEACVELCAFRTVREERGKGYFSALMAFILDDLKKRGYMKAVVGVEPEEKLNKEIYHHWGFTEHVCTGTETYPDGTVIDVEFYGRLL